MRRSPYQKNTRPEIEASQSNRAFDASLITANLCRPVSERLRRHDVALNTALALRKAVQEQEVTMHD